MTLSLAMSMGLTGLQSPPATAPADDTTPDAFDFAPVTGADRSTPYVSNTVTISGINAASPVTVSGGQYRKNGGSWTGAAGEALNGDVLQVRGTSSGSYLTPVSVTLTVGGVSDTFTITTAAEAPPAAVYDSGAITATTSVQTSELWGGVYSCLLSGGTSGNVWQYVAATFGKANIKNWADPTKTFTRARLYGPHEDLSHATSLMGGSVDYACLAGQAGTWEVGASHADPMQTTVGLKNRTTSASFVSHQGLAYLPNGDLIGFDDSTDGGMKVWDRTSGALKWQNASEPQHHGAGKHWSGTMQNISGGGSKTGVIVVPCTNYNGSGTSTGQALRCYSPEAGLPMVKRVDVAFPVGETGAELSSLAIKEATGEIFMTGWYSPKIYRVLLADVVAAAHGGTVNATVFATLTSEIRSLDGSLYHPASDTIWAMGQITLAISATTGKVVSRLAYVNIATGGAGGCDLDPITGKVGISSPDGSGIADSLCMNLFDSPTLMPANLQTGFPMRKAYGMRFPGVRLEQAAFSVFGVAIPKSIGATVRATDQGSQPRQAIIGNSGTAHAQSDIASSRFRWQGPSAATTWRASPTEVIVPDQRWVFGAVWSDASTMQETISYTGNNDNALSSANSASAGPVTRDAWPADSWFGITPRITDGLADLDVGCVAVISGVKLTAAQIGSLRDNPAQIFVVNDPLTSGQRAALESA